MTSDILPRVSCVMVTADRPSLCRRAIWSYQQQTYRNKELVVLDNGEVSMRTLLDVLPVDEVRYVKVDRSPDATLGELRNRALSLATGEYVIPQWDDDDWSHPDRIALQASILDEGNDACALSGTLVHIDEGAFFDRPYIGILPGGVPPTIMHRSDHELRYPPLERGEDTHYVASWRDRNFAELPASFAYLY
ncbi:MAG: glycosyltransferase family 2 protein, partial [Rhodothermia bacterium]|nr:glycosyltransferase family 2 protein [Rhodothermia bacterium]